MKAEKQLNEQQKEKLVKLKEASPLVGIMHSLKEELHELFEPSEDLGTGTLKLIDWLEKAETYYKKSVVTIKRWFGEIVGYFEQKTTNGIVEGINNKLNLLKRCGFGLRNFNNFQIRALLFWHYPNNSLVNSGIIASLYNGVVRRLRLSRWGVVEKMSVAI